jgi:electron transport complex protein RnfC
MLKKMFFGLSNPRIEYDLLPVPPPKPEKVAASKTVTLFHKKNSNQNLPSLFKTGQKVKTGQKISLFANDAAYVISSATGTISSISPYTGDYGQTYIAIKIDIDSNEELDDQFQNQIESPNLESAIDYLSFTPGNPLLSAFADPERKINTIIIRGIDSDLLIGTNQYFVASRLHEVKTGIEILKKISGIDRIILVTAGESIQGFGHIGAEVKRVDTAYPSALPQMIMKNVLGKVVPAGKTTADLGAFFLTAEAVASIGKGFSSGHIPVNKILTFITKDGNRRLVETAIGTPIGDLLTNYGVSVNKEDRIILGGPMMGSAVYSLDHPVLPDTDAILVLDRSEAAYASEYPCTNCGECVRACPARIQIHMLVRFLEAGHYEEAADNYDLYSCIECGLCSFVCESKIPILQYIKLAKYELERAKTAEEANV